MREISTFQIRELLTLPLFSLTLFISAALMFAVQPMAGRMLLPIIGGTPAGWIVTMAFFQVTLLAGYFLAHALSRLPAALHGFLFLLILAAGILFLPARIMPDPSGEVPDAFGIFKMLAVTLAIPFMAISATSSTLQRLFATTAHKDAKDPYFLYAASNLGSFAGLFAYPLLAEPLLGLQAQSQSWFYGYSLLIILIGLCLITPTATLAAYKSSPQKEKMLPISAVTKLKWVLYAFIPSSLLMSVSTHITTDIFSAPMLWVLPLGLYLLTFVIAFARRQFISDELLNRLQPITVTLCVGFLIILTISLRMSWLGLFVQLFGFTICALMCHRQLVLMRPVNSDQHLTSFYLYLSIGGALGGVLNAFVIPYIFDRLIEYPLFLIASLCLNPYFRERMTLVPKMYLGLGLIMTLAYVAYLLSGTAIFESLSFRGISSGMIMADFFLLCILVIFATGARTASIGLLVLLFCHAVILPKNVLITDRNFFGVVKVYERPIIVDNKKYTLRNLHHGTTLHGTQIIEEPLNTQVTSYYSEDGPVGNIFNIYTPKNIAVIGLGVGTIYCYSTPENKFTFFEIDPAIVTMAQKHFTYLKDCDKGTPPSFVIGDGRIEMGKLKNQKFDLIVLDAFSSDTIPTHLLTVEALEEYKKHLTENGLILANLSNRYFNLAPIFFRNADLVELSGRLRFDYGGKKIYETASLWAILGPNDKTFKPLEHFDWKSLKEYKSLRPWTDDYTNLLRMMEFRL